MSTNVLCVMLKSKNLIYSDGINIVSLLVMMSSTLMSSHLSILLKYEGWLLQTDCFAHDQQR
ncbi:hypothetical protein I3842_07G191600 [Carya illinoinensis]|uniref:Uncharacterized protein n=1 Tax=Carya illinoinensis TaxID=32201 RepID=A0A922EQ77_CARIL|nr:hypothetical protein I3842_07G191600 [Carya illinoinensis]